MSLDTPDAVARALGAGADAATLDLSGLTRVRAINVHAGEIWVEAGATWGAVEAAARRRALTLGPIPAWLRTRTVGQSLAEDDRLRPSPQYGQLSEGLLGLRAALPGGWLTHTSVTPRRATGPDLMRCVVGAEGRAGVITDVYLQAWPRPRAEVLVAAAYADWMEALDGAIAGLRAGVYPSWWRVARGRGDVRLVGALPVIEAGAPSVARFTAAIGGRPLDASAAHEAAALFAADAPPTTTAAVFTGRRADAAAYAEATPGARIWDIRPEGATVYGRRPPAPAPSDWDTLAARVFAALEAP